MMASLQHSLVWERKGGVGDTSMPPMTGHNRTGFAVLSGCEPHSWVEWKPVRGFEGGGRWEVQFYSREAVTEVVVSEELKIDRLAQRSRAGDRWRSGRAKVKFADRSDSFSAYAVLGPSPGALVDDFVVPGGAQPTGSGITTAMALGPKRAPWTQLLAVIPLPGMMQMGLCL